MKKRNIRRRFTKHARSLISWRSWRKSMMPADPVGKETVYLDGPSPSMKPCISPLDRGFGRGRCFYDDARGARAGALPLRPSGTCPPVSPGFKVQPPSDYRVGRGSRGTLTKERPDKVASIKVVITRGRSSLPGLPRTGQSTLVVYAGPIGALDTRLPAGRATACRSLTRALRRLCPV